MVELDRPVGERRWFPFTYEEAGLGFNHLWWHNRPVYPSSNSLFLRVLQNNCEVARVHLKNGFTIDHYVDVPPLGAAALEIQFIEVHTDHRGCGLGRAVIRLLRNRYPERRLVALSGNADGFWSSLGWRRHLHPDPEDAPRYPPLFIQPEA